MVEIKKIIVENQRTFYDNRNKLPVRTWPRHFMFAATSVLGSWFLMPNVGEFLNAVNTVLSILLGFSFSVLFFIASSGRVEATNKDSLEQEYKADRVNTLSREIFYNVSYFVALSMTALVVSLILVIPDFWLRVASTCNLFTTICNGAEFARITYYASLFSRIIFAFFLIEAGYTFFRLVERVNFLFEERLSLLDRGRK